MARRPAAALAGLVLLAAAALLLAGAPGARAQGTIYDVVSKDGSFKVLAGGLEKAGFDTAFKNPNLPKITVFAPTDSAFNAVAKKFGVTPAVAFGNLRLLNQVINLHLLPKRLTVSQLLAAPSQDTRVAGYKVAVTPAPSAKGGAAVALRNIANPPVPIVKPDMAASNGIVHGIEGILLPFKQPAKKL